MKKRRTPISAVILAHKGDFLLEQVVESLSWCDEIIILASDAKQEIEDRLQGTQAKIFFRTFEDFGSQKNFAVSLASHDWILNIDSDEVVSLGCRNKIKELLDSNLLGSYSAFRVHRKLVFLKRPMSFSGTSGRPIRFFNRKETQLDATLVHEQFKSSGIVGYIKEPILHYSYASLEDYFTKFNRYTSLGAEELFKEGKSTNFFSIWVRLPLLFLRRFIFQLGFLDGYHGFCWSMLSAWYSSVKYLKLQELRTSQNK